MAKIIDYLSLSNTIIGLIGFLRLSIIVLFLAHWFACLWHLIGVSEENNWLIRHEIENETWDVRYISSIYWVLMILYFL